MARGRAHVRPGFGVVFDVRLGQFAECQNIPRGAFLHDRVSALRDPLRVARQLARVGQ